jgi:LPXTG-motif cell wall-anchored protein
MEQSQQQRNRQRFTQKMKHVGWMCSILAVLFLGMSFVLPPKPFGNAVIDDFAIAKDTIADARIIEKTNVSYVYPIFYKKNKFYELDINTSSGQMFHLKRPDYPSQLTQYLAALPIGKEVSIRYFNRLFDSYVILDVRDENHIFIPFSEIIAGENHNRNFMFIWTGIFALLGAIGFWFGRKKRKRHSISEHTQAHRK